MSSVTFKSRRSVGIGIWEYTYGCKCGNGSAKPDIIVTSSNNNEAQMLAELDCETACGELVADGSLRAGYERDPTNHGIMAALEYPMVVHVSEIADEHIVVETCAGDSLVCPKSVIKSFRRIGSASSSQAGRATVLGRLVLDHSTPEGLLILQLSDALTRALESAPTTTGASHLLPGATTVTVPVQGSACQSPVGYGYYNSTRRITGFALNSATGCDVQGLMSIGPNTLRFMHFASAGTPCGNGYSGKVKIDVSEE